MVNLDQISYPRSTLTTADFAQILRYARFCPQTRPRRCGWTLQTLAVCVCVCEEIHRESSDSRQISRNFALARALANFESNFAKSWPRAKRPPATKTSHSPPVLPNTLASLDEPHSILQEPAVKSAVRARCGSIRYGRSRRCSCPGLMPGSMI